MKKLIIAICLLLMLVLCFRCKAENSLRIKGGVAGALCSGVNASAVTALEYEMKGKVLALGVEVAGALPHIDGLGRLYWLSASVIPKVYYKNMYLGCKGGYVMTNLTEKNVDVDDELSIGGIIGYDFGKWFIETQTNFFDLDIETYRNPTPKIEKRSRGSNWMLVIGRKF